MLRSKYVSSSKIVMNWIWLITFFNLELGQSIFNCRNGLNRMGFDPVKL